MICLIYILRNRKVRHSQWATRSLMKPALTYGEGEPSLYPHRVGCDWARTRYDALRGRVWISIRTLGIWVGHMRQYLLFAQIFQYSALWRYAFPVLKDH